MKKNLINEFFDNSNFKLQVSVMVSCMTLSKIDNYSNHKRDETGNLLYAEKLPS